MIAAASTKHDVGAKHLGGTMGFFGTSFAPLHSCPAHWVAPLLLSNLQWLRRRFLRVGAHVEWPLRCLGLAVQSQNLRDPTPDQHSAIWPEQRLLVPFESWDRPTILRVSL